MESCSLHSPTFTALSPSLPRSGFIAKPPLHYQVLKFHNARNRYPHARNLKFLNVRAQSSGGRTISSGVVETAPKEADKKGENVAFVAGATGKVGSRTVRELLKLGFQVRAGVRSAQKAETLVQSVKQMKIDGEGPQPVELLEIVECDLEKPDQIGAALGNASVVLCCIGASEKEVFDVTGPYRIDYQATKNLIDAAKAAKVQHFILVTSLGTNKFGFPAAILNLFWGVLCWKRKAEEALVASGVPYTIVRPGGMERPTDAYKETHNITLSVEDTLFGGQVSNLQVAELLAVMAKNRILSYCKVVEVVAETTAPLTPMEELLTKIPSKRTPPKEPTVAPPEPAPSKSAISDAPSTPIEKVPPAVKAKESTPLSPYVAYENLKPPSSPSPTPSTTPHATITSDVEPSTPIEKEPPPTVKATETTPLSPYVAYEDLKPPSSPSPTPSTTPQVTKASDVEPLPVASTSAPLTSQVDSSEPSSTITEKVVLETEAKKTRPLSPYIFYEDLKPPSSPSPTPSTTPQATKTDVEPLTAASTSSPSTTQADLSEPSSTITEKVVLETEAKKSRPLSPYIFYDDLKPPSSPIPTAPTGAKKSVNIAEAVSTPVTSGVETSTSGPTNDISITETKSIPEEVKKTRPLSPYAAYEDLKPPTSPCPTPSGPKDKPLPITTPEDTLAPPAQDKDVAQSAAVEFVEKVPPVKSTYHLSPYHVYDDLKPPSSPSPSAPKGSRPSTTSAVDSGSQIPSGNGTAQLPPVDKPSNEHHHAEAKPRPLSPFTMYEDLKPPTSPIPSLRKL